MVIQKTTIAACSIVCLLIMADSKEQCLKSANTEFTLDVYRYMAKELQGQNMFFSPYSVLAAMSMVYLGARGQTAEQMVPALRIHHIKDTVHTEHEKYLEKVLSGSSNFTLNIANRLYPQAKADLVESFFDLSRKFYHADVKAVDFGNPENARKEINEWVSRRTAEKITELIPPAALNPLTVMVLVNAIYFKGNWASQFNKNLTAKAPFINLKRKEIEVDMMFQKQKIPHMYDPDLLCNVVELPYSGDELSMMVILPDAVDGINDVEEKLSQDILIKWQKNLHSVKVNVYLPRFKLESKFEFSKLFKSWGMVDLFTDNADLSGIDASKMTYVSNIFHKAYVDVNEEGTEAAAATGVVIQKRCVEKIEEFRADHPFLFHIRDKRSGVILFAGRVLDFNQVTAQRDEL